MEMRCNPSPKRGKTLLFLSHKCEPTDVVCDSISLSIKSGLTVSLAFPEAAGKANDRITFGMKVGFPGGKKCEIFLSSLQKQQLFFVSRMSSHNSLPLVVWGLWCLAQAAAVLSSDADWYLKFQRYHIGVPQGGALERKRQWREGETLLDGCSVVAGNMGVCRE